MTACLTIDPRKRPSAAELLGHEFLRNGAEWTTERWLDMSRPRAEARCAKHSGEFIAHVVQKVEARMRSLFEKQRAEHSSLSQTPDAVTRLASQLDLPVSAREGERGCMLTAPHAAIVLARRQTSNPFHARSVAYRRMRFGKRSAAVLRSRRMSASADEPATRSVSSQTFTTG